MTDDRIKEIADGHGIYADSAFMVCVRSILEDYSFSYDHVGVVGSMPGTEGFTMSCFKSYEVPIGTSLYIYKIKENK